MQDLCVWTADHQPDYSGPMQTLCDVLQDEEDVPPSFFIPDDDVEIWRHLKGAKTEPRKTKAGFEYLWSEGAIAFPGAIDKPSRTVLTGEGGSSPSRFKHVIESRSGRLRRLTPVELERLNGFRDGWTDRVSDNRRAFLMGNALVVGVVEKIATALAERAGIAHTRPLPSWNRLLCMAWHRDMHFETYNFRNALAILKQRPEWDELIDVIRGVARDDIIAAQKEFMVPGKRTPAGAQRAVNAVFKEKLSSSGWIPEQRLFDGDSSTKEDSASRLRKNSEVYSGLKATRR